MKLRGVVKRPEVPEPWTGSGKIPWHDPAFSKRMLQEHLSQVHDHASRRTSIIDAQVDWIDRELLDGEQSHILDLGCGPGLYTTRLAERGHRCHGIDFSPASIEHAKSLAREHDLACTYDQADMRQADYGDGYDLVMLIHGELNVFQPTDARAILTKAHQSLRMGGTLLLEVHTHDAVKAMGTAAQSWTSAASGLFSDRPYLRLIENHWHAAQQVTTERYYIIDAETADVASYTQSVQAYSNDDYLALLSGAGFEQRSATMPVGGFAPSQDFFIIVGTAT